MKIALIPNKSACHFQRCMPAVATNPTDVISLLFTACFANSRSRGFDMAMYCRSIRFEG